jgi:hypothetical protein
MAEDIKAGQKPATAPKAEAKEEKPKAAKYEVISDFRDINDFSVTHYPGSDVSHFDKERLKNLVDLGLVKKV